MIMETATVLYDGHCGLCSGLVQALLKLDDRRRLRFAPLQGTWAQARLLDAGIGAVHAGGPDSVVLIEGERIWMHSDAVLRVAYLLDWPYRLASFARIVPRGIRDAVYRWVARNRLRFAGRHEQCWLPSAADRARLVT